MLEGLRNKNYKSPTTGKGENIRLFDLSLSGLGHALTENLLRGEFLACQNLFFRRFPERINGESLSF
jgi:hypothetical protein